MSHHRPFFAPTLLLVPSLLLFGAGTLFAGIATSDLSVTKTDGAGTSIPGTTVTYTIVATNNGPNDAVGASAVTVTDTFPGALSNCTWTCVASAGSSCTAAGAGNIADAANLLNGGTATYTATCDVDAAAIGTIDNTASVSSANDDPVMADNSATDTNTLVPTSDLSVTKTDGSATSIAGTAVTYTIVASNAGPSDATGAGAVTVTDTFAGSLSGCSWTCSASAGSSCTAAGSGNIADSADLLVAGTATYTATCDIDSAATGTLDNTATVASANDDPVPADDSATDSNTLEVVPDLSMTMMMVPDMPTTAEPFSLFVTVTNVGPSDATAVAVGMTHPAGLVLSGTTGCDEDPSGLPTCTLGTVAVGQDRTYEMAFEPASPDQDGGLFQGSVSSDGTDATPGDNDAEHPLVLRVAAIEIPTVGQLGMTVLALLLGLAAVRRLSLG